MEAHDLEFRSQLARRLVAYRELRDRLRSRRSEIDAELDLVERRLRSAEALYEAEFGMPAGGRVASDPETVTEAPRFGRFTGLSWADAVTQALREAGKPLHVSEIWENLHTAGFLTESSDPLRSVVSIAVRTPEVVRVAPNTYALDGVTASGESTDAMTLWGHDPERKGVN